MYRLLVIVDHYLALIIHNNLSADIIHYHTFFINIDMAFLIDHRFVLIVE